MNNDIAIHVDHVSKSFHLSSGGSLKHLIVDTFSRRPKKIFTALSDVSFDVHKGETLGIIGRNGAGKSTLLSTIARTMTPSSGHVETSGKISSLLELGAGFHPDLTGRENVFLYGSIMDIPRSVMKERFDKIVEFSGIGDYIDQPVRFYSSGMYVRLGFSVAVQIDPDILLVDEVLAVGDVEFQKRCIQKMNDFRKAGKTLLLISHDLNTIYRISDRIAFLDHGKLIDIGNPSDMVEKYRNTLLQGLDDSSLESEWGTREATLEKVELLDRNNLPTNTIDQNGILRAAVYYHSSKKIQTPVFGFRLEHRELGRIFASNTQIEKYDIPFIDQGDGRLIFEIDVSHLVEGRYVLSFSLHSSDHLTNYHRLENTLNFVIKNPSKFEGIVHLDTSFKLN